MPRRDGMVVIWRSRPLMTEHILNAFLFSNIFIGIQIRMKLNLMSTKSQVATEDELTLVYMVAWRLTEIHWGLGYGGWGLGLAVGWGRWLVKGLRDDYIFQTVRAKMLWFYRFLWQQRNIFLNQIKIAGDGVIELRVIKIFRIKHRFCIVYLAYRYQWITLHREHSIVMCVNGPFDVYIYITKIDNNNIVATMLQ